MYNMSKRTLDIDQSENQASHSRYRQTPIVCITCDLIFFDNVEQLLHFFECHGKDLASLQNRSAATPDLAPTSANLVGVPVLNLNSMPPQQEGGSKAETSCRAPVISSSGARFNPSPPIYRPAVRDLSSSSFSLPPPSKEKTTAAFSRVNKPHLPFSSTTPGLAPSVASPFVINVLNSRSPPLEGGSQAGTTRAAPTISSFWARFDVSPPIPHPMVTDTSLYGSTPSSAQPMYSQLGQTFAYGRTAAPHLNKTSTYAGRARFRNSRVPRNNRPEVPEPIVLSDSEEEGDKGLKDIDLNLSL